VTASRVGTTIAVLSGIFSLISALVVAAEAPAELQLGCWISAAALFTALLLREEALSPIAERSLLLLSVVAGVILIGAPLHWSDDAYRYLFDGTATLNGVHPFAYAPESPKVADWTAQVGGAINHAHLQSIYPPGAQLTFAIGASLGLGVLGWKLVNVLALPLAYALASRSGRRCGAVSLGTAIVAHPLVLQTVCADAHVDAWALPVLAAFFLAAQHTAARGFSAAAGAALGVGAAFKLFPIALPVVVLGRWGAKRATLMLVAAIVTFGALALPFAGLGEKSFGSLGVYSATWTFNPTGWALIRWFVAAVLSGASVPDSIEWAQAAYVLNGGVPGSDWVARTQLVDGIAKLLSACILGGLVIWGWARSLSVEHATVVIIGALWLLSPVVHPWYLLWLLPAACWARHPAALIWCGMIFFAYTANVNATLGLPWGVPLWATLAQLIPCICGHVLTRLNTRT
jgi:alpha-1,6-mannosyltransferase